jgi:hypothetical protein
MKASRDSATHEVRVTVRNTGRLPTALDQAKKVKIVRPDRLVAEFAKDSKSKQAGRPPEFWLAGGETRTIVVRLKIAPGDSSATVKLLSTRGGVVERSVRIP